MDGRLKNNMYDSVVFTNAFETIYKLNVLADDIAHQGVESILEKHTAIHSGQGTHQGWSGGGGGGGVVVYQYTQKQVPKIRRKKCSQYSQN